jgi:hypothetical protein
MQGKKIVYKTVPYTNGKRNLGRNEFDTFEQAASFSSGLLIGALGLARDLAGIVVLGVTPDGSEHEVAHMTVDNTLDMIDEEQRRAFPPLKELGSLGNPRRSDIDAKGNIKDREVLADEDPIALSGSIRVDMFDEETDAHACTLLLRSKEEVLVLVAGLRVAWLCGCAQIGSVLMRDLSKPDSQQVPFIIKATKEGRNGKKEVQS